MHLTRIVAVAAAVALVAVERPVPTRAAPHALASWYRCDKTMYPGNTSVRIERCRRFDLRAAPRPALTYNHHCRYITAHTERCVTWPAFVAAPIRPIVQTSSGTGPCRSSCYSVTGYCSGQIGAWGDPVHEGMIANNWLPRGTPVTIPSLGYHGVVQDHSGGAAFDLFTFDCSQTFSFTGYRQVIIG